MNLKPFDLDRALAGDPVFTISGKKVTDIHVMPDWLNLFRPVFYRLEDGSTFYVTKEGTNSEGWSNLNDLFMGPKTVTKWVNIYKETRGYYFASYNGKQFFNSLEEAKKQMGDYTSIGFVDTVPITWEE